MLFFRSSTYHDVSRGQNVNPWFFVGCVIDVEDRPNTDVRVTVTDTDCKYWVYRLFSWLDESGGNHFAGNDSWDVVAVCPD